MNGKRSISGRAKRGLLPLFLSVALSPAFAVAADKAPVKHTKREVEISGVQQTNLTKPAPPPKDKKAAGPEISLDEFVAKKQDRIQQLNDAAIDKMQRLVKITADDDPEKPDFHFRLAELYAEKQRYYNFQARSLDEKIFQAPPAQKSQLEAQQKRYDEESKKWLLQAVSQYAETRKYKKYPRQDENLFKLAYLLQTVKREDKAREVFLQLIKDYPDSKYVPEAYLSFGEYYFGEGDMNAAMKFYKKVAEFPKSLVYGYAIYKQGWCWINLGDYKKALETFRDVIQIAKTNRGGDKRQNAALEKEAKKDIVKAYARVGNPDKAWEFFTREGGDFAPKMMEILGELYWEQGMFADSSKIYRKMMSLEPQSPKLCEWQSKVLRNTLSAGKKEEQILEVGRLGLAFDRVMELGTAKKDVKAECRAAFHDVTKEIAQIWHREAQKTKNPDTYKLAKSAYKVYLQRFGKDKDAVDMTFFYAEALWMTEDWKDAAEQYSKVVELDPKGKYVREAAYAAVLSWKNALNIDDQGQGPDKEKTEDKEFKPLPIPEYQKKMIAAFDTYLRYVPDAPETVKIKYNKARIYYDYNHFDEAVKYFSDIVENHPKDELAIYSANLLLDSLNLLKRPKEVVKWVEKFMERPELMKDPEFAKQMVALRTDTLDVEARLYEEQGNFKQCGMAFEAAADSLPDHAKHAERLFNAGLCYTNARLIGQAVKVRQELIERHPADPLAQRALFQIAAGYHQIASYTNAADRYESFANKFPGEDQAPQALGNAFSFRMGLGEYDKARKDLDSYIKFYGGRKPQDAADKFFQMAFVYQREGRTDELIKHLQTYLAKWGKQGSPDKEMYAHFWLGELLWKKSCPHEGVNGACIAIERVSATGREKAFYDLNKKITDKRKKLKSDKGRKQCGPPTHSKITVFDRSPKLSAEAQGHFKSALTLWNSGSKKIGGDSAAEQQSRLAAAQYAAAGAAFYQSEKVYEEFLKVKFPEGLELQPPGQFDSPKKAKIKKERFAADQKKFKAYLTQKRGLGAKLAGGEGATKGMYEHVVDMKSAHWTIAALARIGQVYANFVDQLYTAEIPKFLKDMDEYGVNQKEIFCDSLVDVADPIEKNAAKAYDLCLKGATQQSWFNEWSHMCEVELNQMQPSEYPLAAESRPEAGFVPTVMTPPPVMSELPQNATMAKAEK